MKRDVWLMDVATGKTFALTNTGNCIKPTWAYDSRSIYYSMVVDKSEDIWVATELTLKSTIPERTRSSKKSRAGSAIRRSTSRSTQR